MLRRVECEEVVEMEVESEWRGKRAEGEGGRST
jgi:hypothetical protein